MIWVIPIEPLPERYTAQFLTWVENELQDQELSYYNVLGTRDPDASTSCKPGQFLNWTGTISYKASQLRAIARLFANGRVQNGDKFFVFDIWFPGIEAIRYMAQMEGINVELWGVQHAGVFDDTDLVHKLHSWGAYQEAAWYRAFDGVFVGSNHIADKIQTGLACLGLPPAPLYVTGMPWESRDVRINSNRMEDVEKARLIISGRPTVLWPHRMSADKNFASLLEIANRLEDKYPQLQFVCTSGQQHAPDLNLPNLKAVSLTKGEYYALLCESTCMLSTAFHENFGYTVFEATALHRPIVCPRRACYPEMITTPHNLYSSDEEAAWKIDLAIQGKLPVARLQNYGGHKLMVGLIQQGVIKKCTA
jgi:glycosyltransferase involved in cell wall biosynthesis